MFDWLGWMNVFECSAFVQTLGGRRTYDFCMHCTWQTSAVLNVAAVR